MTACTKSKLKQRVAAFCLEDGLNCLLARRLERYANTFLHQTVRSSALYHFVVASNCS